MIIVLIIAESILGLQEEVFDEISQLVQSALDGYKVCIFAYGQTGSGKTHTMLGTQQDRGMIPRAMDQIFASSAAMEAQGWSFDMKVRLQSARCLIQVGRVRMGRIELEPSFCTAYWIEGVPCMQSRIRAVSKRVQVLQ